MGSEVRVSEVCSCGASFEIRHRNAVSLVREWREAHVCVHGEPTFQAVHGGADASHTLVVGFQATGLNDPARSPYPEWDE